MAAWNRRSGGSVRSKAASAPGTAARVGSSSRTEAASSTSLVRQRPGGAVEVLDQRPELALAIGQRAGHTRGARHQARQVAWLLAAARLGHHGQVAQHGGGLERGLAQRRRGAALGARLELRQGRLEGLAGGRVEGGQDLVELDRPGGLAERDHAAVLELRRRRAPRLERDVNPPSRNSRGRIRSRASRCTGRPSSMISSLSTVVSPGPSEISVSLPTSTPAIAHRRALAELVRAGDDGLDLVLRSRRELAW